MNRTRWAWLLLLTAAVLYFVFASGGPEGKIRARLQEVEELLEKAAGEKSLAAVDKARKLGDTLTGDFAIVLEPYGQTIADQNELGRAFVGFRQSYETIHVGLSIEQIEFDARGRTATTSIRATFLGTGGELSRESWDGTIAWRLEGDWKMQRVQITGKAEGLL